jgi:hypothetical protein
MVLHKTPGKQFDWRNMFISYVGLLLLCSINYVYSLCSHHYHRLPHRACILDSRWSDGFILEKIQGLNKDGTTRNAVPVPSFATGTGFRLERGSGWVPVHADEKSDHMGAKLVIIHSDCHTDLTISLVELRRARPGRAWIP